MHRDEENKPEGENKGDVEGVLAGLSAFSSVLALPFYSLLAFVS
jgi:hypothetical protein